MMMLKRKKFIFIATFVFVFALAGITFGHWQKDAPAKPNTLLQGDYTYAVDYADYRIQRLMKQHHLPGVAVALIDDQHTIWQEAFGLANVEKGVPAQVDTVYKLWSVAKVFTAIETMRLVDEGLVDLDAPITDYLPDFSIQNRFEGSGPITVRSILAHHSGLPRNECYALRSGPGDPDVLGEMADTLKYCHMAFPVGTRYKYSNIGPDVLGALIQELRGEAFPKYMQENLLARIGMGGSAFLSTNLPGHDIALGDATPGDVAPGDVALGYAYYKGEYYPLEQRDITSLPSGNLYATLEDMAGFAKFIFRGGEAQGEQIINPETLALMFEDQYSSHLDPQPMGLGWKVTRVLGSEWMVWHDGGSSEGIGSLVALLPERKLGVILFANEVSFEGHLSTSLAVEILERMLETKYGIVIPVSEAPERVDLDRSLLEAYTGRYIAFGQVMDVSLRGDKLKASFQGMNLDLIPIDQTRFRVSHWLLRLGLADLFQLPIDLRELEIEFFAGDEPGQAVLIINIGGFAYEICPGYPVIRETPVLWEALSGAYELLVRLPSGSAGNEVIGRDEILIEDGVLTMPGVIGPLIPVSETGIIILSGSFAGETMVYDPGTGTLSHQWVVYRSIERE